MALATAKPSAIIAKDIEMIFEFGEQRFPVLKGIDLEIPPGEMQLFMGPSGSGKTTLLSVLAGILTPTTGKVWLLGAEITAMSPAKLSRFRAQQIGFIFQGFNLFPALNATENVELALNVRGINGIKARREAEILLEKVGLGAKKQSLPRDLSGGQKQRVAIARALAGHPPLIMADEPTAALDSQNGHAIIELLHHLTKAEGCTAIIVTHDPRIVDFADKVLYLEDGAFSHFQSP